MRISYLLNMFLRLNLNYTIIIENKKSSNQKNSLIFDITDIKISGKCELNASENFLKTKKGD